MFNSNVSLCLASSSEYGNFFMTRGIYYIAIHNFIAYLSLSAGP